MSALIRLTVLVVFISLAAMGCARLEAGDSTNVSASDQSKRAIDPLRIVCFGDSITGHRPGEPYLHSYIKWSDLLELMIEARRGLGKAEVLNRGFAGDRTYPVPHVQTPGAVTRLQRDVLDERPRIAVVLIGGNDHKATEEQRAQTRDNLRTMVRQMRQADIRVLLLQYAVLPNPDAPEGTWRGLNGNNDLIAEVARHEGVPTLALQPAFDEAHRAQPQPELMNPVDGVHLAPGGERVLARAVFKKLSELGWLE
ncbi:MAG: hypothetical protein JJU36_12520 [Phycisphaeraceae bacterium]|nr:hypothetical protein [Phycisphaeraceae bacterium]